MKVLLMSPGSKELHPGAAGTVLRYREGLQRRGTLCEVFGGSSEGDLKQSLEGTISRFKPDIVHAHDVSRCGMHLLGLRMPWVVSVRNPSAGMSRAWPYRLWFRLRILASAATALVNCK